LGWGFCDPTALTLVNVKISGVRGSGMVNTKETALVIYGPQFKKKTNKSAMIERYFIVIVQYLS